MKRAYMLRDPDGRAQYLVMGPRLAGRRSLGWPRIVLAASEGLGAGYDVTSTKKKAVIERRPVEHSLATGHPIGSPSTTQAKKSLFFSQGNRCAVSARPEGAKHGCEADR